MATVTPGTRRGRGGGRRRSRATFRDRWLAGAVVGHAMLFLVGVVAMLWLGH